MFRKNSRGLLVRLAAIVVLAFPLGASAVPITGGIGFSGLFNPTGGTGLGDATGISFSNAFVATTSGIYAGIPAPFATVANFTDFQFSPLAPDPVDPLWTVSFGGVDYSFSLEDVSVDFQDNNELNLSGSGILSATGFDDTAGTWEFSGNTAGTILFSFSSISAAAASEPGILFLLAMGLPMLGVARRINNNKTGVRS
ncbi:MAG: hypothetical protein OEQ74_01790 [Gammaproteobacteria bacterium]|nr:hypothetical protein [Gammaproteobacteria bacterium]